MRWESGSVRRHRRRLERMEWHPWFAWHPVATNDGQTVWLETVMRRVDPLVYDALVAWREYRLPYANEKV